MATIFLTVNQSNAYAEVNKATAYLATKNGDKTEFDRVATADADTDLLDRYYEEAIGILNTVMREYLNQYTMLGSISSFSLVMPSAYDTTLNTALNTAVRSFVISYILSKWLVVVDKKEATNAEHEAAEHLLDIRAKMYYRKKPVRVSPLKKVSNGEALDTSSSGTDSSTDTDLEHADKNTTADKSELSPDTDTSEIPGYDDNN